MMMLDMTRELSPLLMGLDATLVISALGILSAGVGALWTRRMPRPRLTLQRPALAGAR